MPSTRSAARSEPTRNDSAAGSSASERSLRLLALVAEQGRALSLPELATLLGLPKVTVHRLCAQLVSTGHLARDVQGRAYGVGPALRRLAYDTLNHDTLRGLRHEVLSGLVADVKETCNFTTLDGTRVLYVDRVEAQWPLRLALDVGSHVPLHCTASGKLFLAHMAPAQRDALLAQTPLQALTPNTVTDRAELLAQCRLIGERGYATDNEEFIPGLIAVAVPVTDAQGQTRAGIAVHAPVARMDLATALGKLPQLREAAVRMGRLV